MKRYCPYCRKVHDVELTSHARNTRSSSFVVYYYYCKDKNVYFSDNRLDDENHAAAKEAMCGVYA